MALKIVAIFREFDFFRNKAKNVGRFHKKMLEERRNAIAGWLTPRCENNMLYIYCCNLVAVKLVSSS